MAGTVATFRIPAQITVGCGAVETVGTEAKRLGGTRAFVIADPNLQKTGITDRLMATLQGQGVEARLFAEVEPEPSVHSVATAATAAKSNAPILISGETGTLRPRDPAWAQLRALRTAAIAAPADAAAVVPLARRYFGLAMAEGDPRYVGYAQAALAPGRAPKRVPPEILVLRALLRQYRHDFDGALADLALAVQLEPRKEEARAWRAAIHMVRADYPVVSRTRVRGAGAVRRRAAGGRLQRLRRGHDRRHSGGLRPPARGP